MSLREIGAGSVALVVVRVVRCSTTSSTCSAAWFWQVVLDTMLPRTSWPLAVTSPSGSVIGAWNPPASYPYRVVLPSAVGLRDQPRAVQRVVP